MTATLTAVYERHDDWFTGYVEELSGVNIQEATLEEARESLREAVQLIIESNRFLAQHSYFTIISTPQSPHLHRPQLRSGILQMRESDLPSVSAAFQFQQKYRQD
jgi:predicted RNase H-like HicB family nuclease